MIEPVPFLDRVSPVGVRKTITREEAEKLYPVDKSVDDVEKEKED